MSTALEARRARSTSSLGLLILTGLAAALVAGCSEEDAGAPATKPGGEGGGGAASALPSGAAGDDGTSAGAGGGPDTTPEPSLYAMNSLVFGEDATSSYLNLLTSLDAASTDFSQAREFAGSADIWLHEGALFVALSDDLTITKFTLDGDELVEGASISFANYGLTSLGFWLNAFVAPDKAYVQNGAAEYVIWNPETMEISGTLTLPELAPRAGLKPFLGYADRAAQLRDGLLYQPVYYTDESYFEYDPASTLVVIDTATDEIVSQLEVPCPGIDFSTRDADHNLYFSSWVFAPGGAAVLEQPTTCVARLAAGEDTATKLFDLPDVTDGRQGGVMRYLGDGKALISVLHDDNSSAEAVADVTYGANWRFWLYDLAEGTAAPVDALDWSAGAAYPLEVAGKPHMLVPSGDYASTQLFEIGTDGAVRARIESQGWAVRLFGLR